MKKAEVILLKSKDKCCGCGLCSAICPVCAITMEPDIEGFLYPVISNEKCIKCHKCIQMCIMQNDNER